MIMDHKISYDHVCKELQKSSKCTQLSFRANNDLLVYIVKSDDQEYRLDCELTQCSCRFWLQYNLPCRHIFALREKMDMPIFQNKLIPKRWQKILSENILFVQ